MKNHQAPSRRDAMIAASGILLATATNINPTFAMQQEGEEKDLIFRTTDPRNGEPELSKLVQNWITPNKHFYVRSHAPNPILDPKTFRLKIEGAVRKPVTVSLGDLAKYKRHEITATLTCAGNRRTEYNAKKKVGGVQWESGAIGNAVWGGYALSDVLKEAELLEDAAHVCFEGLDEIEKGDKTIPFGASVPIEKAMMTGESLPGVLIADTMNGAPLPADHGYPLRTVVPGYIGARSVKWLGRIIVSDRPSSNHYVAKAYKVVKKTDSIDWREAGPIYRFPINAAICTPEPTMELQAGEVELAGYALPTGRDGSKIKHVFVSADQGKSWIKAEMEGEAQSYCWQLWKAKIKVDSSTKVLLARANDTSGEFMPFGVPWNAKGYLQNSWYRVKVKVS